MCRVCGCYRWGTVVMDLICRNFCCVTAVVEDSGVLALEC